MSLMRLLTAGKTLISSGEPVAHYRLDARYRLPKFGSAKNPFASPTEAKPAVQVEMQIPTPVQMTPEVEKIALKPEESKVVALEETQPLPPTPVSVPVEKPVHPILALLDAIDLWAIRMKARLDKIDLAKLKKFIYRRKPVAIPVAAKSGHAPMQAELSLEKVQVVRNDLSDADLEIVPMQASQPTAPKPVRRERKKTKTDAEPELVSVEA